MTACWIWESGCKGDTYAAWVQAIGSVLALVIVIAIEILQNKREMTRVRDATLFKHRQQLKGILFLATAMRKLLEENFPNPNSPEPYDKVSLVEASGDLLSEIRQYATDELTDEERNSYFSVRRHFSAIFSHMHFGDESAHVDKHISKTSEFEKHFSSYLKWFVGRIRGYFGIFLTLDGAVPVSTGALPQSPALAVRQPSGIKNIPDTCPKRGHPPGRQGAFAA